MIRDEVRRLLWTVISDLISLNVYRSTVLDCTDDEIRYLLEHESRRTARKFVEAEARRRGLLN